MGYTERLWVEDPSKEDKAWVASICQSALGPLGYPHRR